jgi:ketosteroid isomerase-like protein
MTTPEIAGRLVELCSTNQNRKAYEELFAQDAVAVDSLAHTQGRTTEGLTNLLANHDQFESGIEAVHGGHVSQPLVAGNFFTVEMSLDATMKDGNRMHMEEVVVYEVKDGKIVKEQFFY